MSASSRITKLERTIRKAAREEFIKRVLASFEPAVTLASNDDDAAKHLFDARNAVIKAGTKKVEDDALERFLAEKAPEPAPATLISLDALRNPTTVKIAANGERLPDTSKDAVAILLPQFDLLYTVETWAASNWKDAVKLGAAVELFDGAGQWQLWDDLEAGLTIDRSVHGPAVIPAFRDCTPTDDWYWTRTPLASSPSDHAFYVDLHDGYVGWIGQDLTGRVRAVRRVPASQFGVLAA